jgi:hypothetical protein
MVLMELDARLRIGPPLRPRGDESECEEGGGGEKNMEMRSLADAAVLFRWTRSSWSCAMSINAMQQARQ